MAQTNLVLFYCGLRSGHFGQGAFVNSLLPYFKTKANTSITLIKTDCDGISAVFSYVEEGMNILAIPHLPNIPMLTGENHPVQKAYAQQIIGIIYPFLKDKPNLLFWVNSIDYLNVSYELKQVFTECKLMYVHHSFSWKYFINVPDRTFIQEWQTGNDGFHPKAFEMTRYQQEIALLSDITITVTNHARNFFIEVLHIPASKVVTIYNGMPVPTNKNESKQVLRKKYGFARNDKIVLFSGRVTKDKGIPDLLRAFSLLAGRMEKLKLVVMGAGHFSEFISMVNPHWSKIIYTGELPPEQVRDFYRLADIGVIPSLHEQCSFTAIEMRLHQLPLIVSGVDGLDELFTHEYDTLKLTIALHKNGMKYLDEKEFADHMERLITDKKLAKLLRRNSYNLGIKLYNRQRMWQKYDQALTTVLEKDKDMLVVSAGDCDLALNN
ncbi:glycosyltransferase [Rhodocytophaga rosea]|uniref:Glycosyltransferase n=1 Tax=Rhodocytophaga rosea TaxID=2704465 RepID=A0A6C0GFM0_9BACT|nr:glycosyltransferase [Rhodocytophaga rosea]QHT66796.1 glycosyltransferase [Rhodocytophaga rosea]